MFRPADGPYIAAHNLIRAHAKAYRIYESKYKQVQDGIVGITLSTEWAEPQDPDSEEDKAAADRFLQVRLLMRYLPEKRSKLYSL